jgi:hypothetical protein
MANLFNTNSLTGIGAAAAAHDREGFVALSRH